jgi:hypothetical protein
VVAPVTDDDAATVPVNAVSGMIERDVHGTVMGHDRHNVPDMPHPEGARVITERGLSAEFSGGERRFFESEPLNTEFEPEFKQNNYTRMVLALAVSGVFLVAVWGYVRYRRAEPIEAQQTAPAPVNEAPAVATPPPAEPPPPAPPPVAATQEPATPPPAPPPAAAPEPVAAPAPTATIAAPATPPPVEKERPVSEPAPPAVVEKAAPPTPSSGIAKMEAKVKEATAESLKTPKEHHAAPVATTSERPRSVKPGTDLLSQPPRHPVRPVTSLDPTVRPMPGAAPAKPAAPPPREVPPLAARPVKVTSPTLPPSPPGALTKPTKPAKRRGGEDDPDGTLPLSID